MVENKKNFKNLELIENSSDEDEEPENL